MSTFLFILLWFVVGACVGSLHRHLFPKHFRRCFQKAPQTVWVVEHGSVLAVFWTSGRAHAFAEQALLRDWRERCEWFAAHPEEKSKVSFLDWRRNFSPKVLPIEVN